ncbi:NACHT domain-containing protein [Streptomyces neyagawaensis]|uniref:NACHT domain-containing protein n=1 Tax=Streptomyces neyagawaensis TaxID=42238 RepID=UPI0006E2FABE|nr:NACHT domain-containing protein [Streptomyces neyagawaensis]MDE1687052.1 NACHT domain-containing protein [Streptomyces neyagawaensis]
MGYALHPHKVKIVTGPPQAGPLHEFWAHLRRPFVSVFWHLRGRWLLHRGVTRAGRWWNPPFTTALVALVAVLTAGLVVWSVLAVLDLAGTKKVVKDFGPQGMCDNGNAAACDTVSGVAMPLLLFAASTLLFLSWRLWQVRRYCTYQARHDPGRLVQTAGSLMDEVVGRDQLCNALMKNLNDKKVRRPHVVVGGVGAGKTALLVRLAQKLAAVGAVPIPVRLRDVQGDEPLDFSELALARFREIVRPKVRSEGEVDRIWRWLRQRADRIVVLADGLEEAFAEDGLTGRRDNLIREAIRRAGEEGLPLVIASRPHDPLRAMQAAVSELEPLSNEAALRYIAGSGSWRADLTVLDRIVEAADMAESPIYLKIARDLHAQDLLEPLWDGGGDQDLQLYDSWRLRAELMETWIHALVDGDVHPELPIDHDTRLAVVEYISALACVGLASDSADVGLGELSSALGEADSASWGRGLGMRAAPNTEWNRRVARALDRRMAELRWCPETYAVRRGAPWTVGQHPCQSAPGGSDWWVGPRIDIRIAATWGTRMGLVHENGDKVRFQHSIVQAYLGSRFLDEMFGPPDAADPQPSSAPASAAAPPDAHIAGALRQGGRELLIALTLYSRSPKGRCVCGPSGAGRHACFVDRTRELLTAQAKGLLAEATDALHTVGQDSGGGGLDDHDSPRLRALENYGTAVEIDSVGIAPRQQDLVKEIERDWLRLGQNEDPARLREAKLALVRQCGTAVRRVAAVRSRAPGDEHPAYPVYEVMFRIGRKETDRRVREALVKEVGAGGEPAYQALCSRLTEPCATLEAGRRRGPAGRVTPSADEVDGHLPFSWDLAEQREREERRAAEEEALAEKGRWNCNAMRAWLLPLLVDSSVMARRRASPRDDLDNWVRVATGAARAPITDDGPGAAVGLGVTLAQGFKYAANRRPGPGVNRGARDFLVKQARDLLKQSTFWYTRLTLLHALTLWSLPDDVTADQPIRGPGSDPRGQVREWLALGDRGREEHPLVAGAAKLAVRALQTRRPERFLWIDEAALASCIGTEVGAPGEQRAHNLWIPPSTGWSTLDPRAQQLLADVLLLMVLGERSHRPNESFPILERCAREPARTPSCLRRDRTRLRPVRGAERVAQPGSNCTHDCWLRMCPYPAKVESLRMEFSEVFCLHQRDLLKKWQPWAWASLRFRREAPWQRGVPVAGMRRFWDQMSDRARDIGPGTDPVSSDGRRFAQVSRSR